jgi:hypothetical protein
MDKKDKRISELENENKKLKQLITQHLTGQITPEAPSDEFEMNKQ